MSLVLDAGALIGIDRRDERVRAFLEASWRMDTAVVTSAAVVAQVWRGGPRQALLARTLMGVEAIALTEPVARQLGELLARCGSADVVDAHVAMLCRTGDTVLTSDPDDLQRLLVHHSAEVRIVAV